MHRSKQKNHLNYPTPIQTKENKNFNCNSLRNQKHVESHSSSQFLSPYVFQFQFKKIPKLIYSKLKKERENKEIKGDDAREID